MVSLFGIHRRKKDATHPRALLVTTGATYGAALTGAEYANRRIKEALSKRYDVTDISTGIFLKPISRGIIRNFVEVSMLVPLLLAYTFLFHWRYDIIVASWSPRRPFRADLVYVQPWGAFAARAMDPFPAGSNLAFRHAFSTRGPVSLSLRFLRRVSMKDLNFCANSRYSQEMILKSLGRVSYLLYPPAPVHLYQLPESKEDMVITLSRISEEKNLELIALVGVNIPQARFVLCGKGGGRSNKIITEIEAHFAQGNLGSKFQHLGWAFPEDKKALLMRSKVIFHPTQFESFGIAIVEGMAAGCIPVVHNSGGPKEFVPPEWLFDTPDEAEDKIRLALQAWTPDVGVQMRKIALKFGESAFDENFLKVSGEISNRKAKLQTI